MTKIITTAQILIIMFLSFFAFSQTNVQDNRAVANDPALIAQGAAVKRQSILSSDPIYRLSKIREVNKDVSWPKLDPESLDGASELKTLRGSSLNGTKITAIAEKSCKSAVVAYEKSARSIVSVSNFGQLFDYACVQLVNDINFHKLIKDPAFLEELATELPFMVRNRLDVAYYNMVSHFALPSAAKLNKIERAYKSTPFGAAGVSIENFFMISQIILIALLLSNIILFFKL